MTRAVRGVAALLLGVYVVTVGLVLLAAEPTLAVDAIDRAESWLDARGAPAWVTRSGRVEFVLNAVMFALLTLHQRRSQDTDAHGAPLSTRPISRSTPRIADE